jgi:hypothetical protein
MLKVAFLFLLLVVVLLLMIEDPHRVTRGEVLIMVTSNLMRHKMLLLL